MVRRWWKVRPRDRATVRPDLSDDTASGRSGPRVIELIDLGRPPRKLVPLENLLPAERDQDPPTPTV